MVRDTSAFLRFVSFMAGSSSVDLLAGCGYTQSMMRALVSSSWKFLCRKARNGGFWFSIYALAIVVVTAWLCYMYRCKLGMEPLSVVVRNIGMVSGGLIALGLAVWRSNVANWQASTARKSLLNDQYQRAAEMLGHSSMVVRIGGVQTLTELAIHHKDAFYGKTLKLIASFASNPSVDPTSRADVEIASTALRKLLKLREEATGDGELWDLVPPDPEEYTHFRHSGSFKN